MTVEQIYQIMNDAMGEVLGEEQNLLKEDLSNIVDIGDSFLNRVGVDPFTKALVDRIGKTVFVNRVYEASVPKIMKSGWEYGAILQKISGEMPDATVNESWELQDGQSYDTNVYTKPSVQAKYFNKKVTFEIPQSVADRQMKTAFTNASAMNSFISMLYNEVEKSMTVKLAQLTRMCVNNMIGETMYKYNPAGTYTGAGDTRAINLLKRYNDDNGQSLQVQGCLESPAFLRYASKQIALTRTRLKELSVLFNVMGKARFTPTANQKIVLLNDFVESAQMNLESDTFHNEIVKLPQSDVVPFWQGSGDDFAFSKISEVKIHTASGHDVDASGVLGVIFDDEACCVCNENRRTVSHRVEKAEFVNFWHKSDASYFNDLNENFVVFYVA